jgi:hypothetical protein
MHIFCEKNSCKFCWKKIVMGKKFWIQKFRSKKFSQKKLLEKYFYFRIQMNFYPVFFESPLYAKISSNFFPPFPSFFEPPKSSKNLLDQ